MTVNHQLIQMITNNKIDIKIDNVKNSVRLVLVNLLMIVSFVSVFNEVVAQGVVKPKEVVISELPTKELRTLDHTAFKAGEELKYRLHYGFVDAGEAIISIKKTSKKVRDREMLHVVATGKTLKGFNWMFKVDDLYESYIDKEGVFPWIFKRRVDEGGYIINQDYVFHQHKRAVDNKDGKQFETPASVQDMISAFFYARTFDFTNLNEGDVFDIKTFVDNEMFTLSIKFVEKETIKLRNGKYKCLKFVPVVQEGRVFKSSEDLQVWITDDGNKIPILAKAKVLVGSIKMELIDYSGLANPISKVEDD